jgi:hypothetical protein
MHIINRLLRLVGCKIDTGEMLLFVSGPTEIDVSLNFTPKHVWLNFDSTRLNRSDDGFDVRIKPNGFVITAHLVSDQRRLEWVATN